MNAIVTPADVDMEDVDSSKSPRVPVASKEELSFPVPESAFTRKLKRLEKLLDKCVQNQELRAEFLRAAQDKLTLRRTHSDSDLQTTSNIQDGSTEPLRRAKSSSSLHWELWSEERNSKQSEKFIRPHNDVVPSDKLPFPQRAFIYSKTSEAAYGGFLDSIMLPTLVSWFSIAATTYAMIWNYIAEMFAFVDIEESSKGILKVVGPLLVMATILLLSMFLMNALLEIPYRVLLFYRLWEHKIVVNFKQRKLSHRATRLKIVGLAASALMYLLFGFFVLKAKQGFYIVFLQGFTTLGFAMYGNVNPDKMLFNITGAARQQKRVLEKRLSVDTTKEVSAGSKSASGLVAASIRPQLDSCFNGLLVVDEVDVKYDILTLAACFKDLDARTKKSMSKQTYLDWIRFDEEEGWLSALFTYIGRLRNTKASMRNKLKRRDHGNHGAVFMSLYDDEVWHDCGSFAKEENTIQATGYWRQHLFLLILAYSIVVLLLSIVQVFEIAR